MERSKPQYLPRKQRSKKLETECNQIKQEQTKLHHQSQQDTGQYQQLCKKTDDLQEGLSAEQIINEKQKKLTDLENEVDGLKVTGGKKEHAIKSLREEKDDFLTRTLQGRIEENAELRGTIERYKEEIADMSKQLELTTEGNLAANLAEEGLNREIQDKAKTIQWQRSAEKNAELRCTIEGYKEQTAEMTKQFGGHQEEKAYILSMANYMVTWITTIKARKMMVSPSTLSKPHNMSLHSFVDNMELILNHVTSMKNEMLTTEGNLAAKLADVGKWMDEQRQTEEDLNQEIQDKAKKIDEQENELKIRLSRIQEIGSASANMKNESNRLRQELLNQKKADQQHTDQSHKLVLENDELKRSWHHMNMELQQRAATIASLQRAMQDLRYQIDQKDDKIKDIKREAEDLRTRLNSLAGDKLTKGTPAITEIGDPNRPMKIAEKYGELYDNEWTNAIDCTVEVKALYPEMETAEIDQVIIRHIYQLVMNQSTNEGSFPDA